MTSRTIRLYHGTSAVAAEQIRAAGRIAGPVFLSPSRNQAAAYASIDGNEGAVVEVAVEAARLGIDPDRSGLYGNEILSVEDANAQSADREGWTIDDYLDRGYSVAVADDLAL